MVRPPQINGCMGMYVSMYVCIYRCMYVCLYVCSYLCVQVCMYVCLYVCMYAARAALVDIESALLNCLGTVPLRMVLTCVGSVTFQLPSWVLWVQVPNYWVLWGFGRAGNLIQPKPEHPNLVIEAPPPNAT